MNEAQLMNAFAIISSAGSASSIFLSAVKEASLQHYEQARELVQQGKTELVDAHKRQTSLIQEESKGNEVALSLTMVHAQDHLMNSILLEMLVNTIIDLYERLGELQK